ncbi:MAG: peptidoglycan DD-metalloendopeptidase family protein [Candidatus Gracilibacteria bacterium]|jgi:murein DD-endopeptidase MepM/ murein hydrolase activator NlpD|nr:peptidoglycan DD-metalloendopeptidase family protein [Candidatus Gracilibacteria bacterium]
MKIKTKIIAILALTVFVASSFALALSIEEKQVIEQEFEKVYKSRYSSRLSESQQRLNSIQKSIDKEYEKFNQSLKQSEEVEQKLVEVQKELKVLTNQLENISIQLDESNRKVEAIKLQINKKTLDLEILYEEKEKLEVETENQKNIVLGYFKMLQKENAIIGSDEVKNTLRLLIADNSFSSHLRNENYISSWEKVERQIFHDLEQSANQLNEATIALNKERSRMQELKKLLEKENKRISIQKQAKEELVRETKNQQDEYKKLWEESKNQMAESAEAISNLRENAASIKEKIQLLEEQKRKKAEENANQEVPLNMQDGIETDTQDESIYEVGKIFEDEDSKSPLDWPVSPLGGITAYYHDEGYEDTFNMEHNAIDLRCDQGTAIKSPELGFVYKVADNGMGYSYIILAHKNNITTLYGHVSKILVKEGDMVKKGQIIGLSGGTPGTKGAGVITTGAHLHFEVFEDGEHQNPLDYLPIDKLPIEYIPEKYLKEKQY